MKNKGVTKLFLVNFGLYLDDERIESFYGYLEYIKKIANLIDGEIGDTDLSYVLSSDSAEAKHIAMNIAGKIFAPSSKGFDVLLSSTLYQKERMEKIVELVEEYGRSNDNVVLLTDQDDFKSLLDYYIAQVPGSREEVNKDFQNFIRVILCIKEAEAA